MNKTLIEWVKNPDGTQGYTWNVITGCMNHINGMCKGGGFPCYAYRLANGRLRERYLANTNLAPDAKGGVSRLTIGSKTAIEREGDYSDPFYPRFWVSRAGSPYHKKTPAGIFVCDMGELFGDWIPASWQESVFATIKDNPQHRFYLLTKQPQNLIKFSPFPDNCWVGVTATDSYDFINRIGYLGMTKAKVKYMSFEPLLAWDTFITPLFQKYIELLDWLIIGRLTGYGHTYDPEIEWVEEIVRAADRAGIAVFLKDNLRTLILDSLAKHQIDRDRYLKNGLLRQELPEGGRPGERVTPGGLILPH